MDEKLRRFMEIMACREVIRQFCDEKPNANVLQLTAQFEMGLADEDTLIMAEFKKVLSLFQEEYYKGKRMGLYGIYGNILPLQMLKVLKEGFKKEDVNA